MIKISHPTAVLKGEVILPGSKSISNRALILRELYAKNKVLNQLSNANDTLLLQQALESEQQQIDVADAGTVARFLTAFYSAKPGTRILRGTPRMHERPISELVDALIKMGADINYLDKEGHLPLKIHGKALTNCDLDLRSLKSSQFASALIMLLPSLSAKGQWKVDPTMNSWAFVQLTLDVMKEFGFDLFIENDLLEWKSRNNQRAEYTIEPDWTSFYYWLSMAILSKGAELYFPGLHLESPQSESKWLKQFGNQLSYFEDQSGLHIKTKGNKSLSLKCFDLKDHPDLAPTFAILSAGCVPEMQFTGLESLKVKESDRDFAIAEQLAKMNVYWKYNNQIWSMDASDFQMPKNAVFQSYDDHRMAMAVAPLSLIQAISIDNEAVVAKSYPQFWDVMKELGFELEFGD